jgi:hypothetical protein
MTLKVQKRARPRVQPNWDDTIVSDRRFKLSRELSEELREIAELDEDSQRAKNMLFAVTEELSMFTSARAARDQSPRPAHKRRLLEPLVKRVKKEPPETWIEDDDWIDVAVAVTWQPNFLGWEFKLQKVPEIMGDEREEFVKTKEWLNIAEIVLARLREEESRHGPSQKAKHRLVNNLASIFDTYAEPQLKEDRETLRAEFVNNALTAVGIEKVDPKKLRHKSTSRLVRELPESFTPAMAARGRRLYKKITRAATAKGQSLEVFLTENPDLYVAYRDAVTQRVKTT